METRKEEFYVSQRSQVLSKLSIDILKLPFIQCRAKLSIVFHVKRTKSRRENAQYMLLL